MTAESGGSTSSSGGGSTSTWVVTSIPVPLILLSTLPLLLVAVLSSRLNLDLTSPIIVGCLRTFAQLSALGFVLDPIFAYGYEMPWVVCAYVAFMTVLASDAAHGRTRYRFRYQFPSVLVCLGGNLLLAALFAFVVVIRQDPSWNPQYVIPICGMMLGNCINGVSLSLDAILSGLVEQRREVELWLAFGADGFESSGRLVREAIRAGATPHLNSMAVIGLVSIPGMMTGQILGGSPVVDAARYQMLIMYLNGMCAFGSILTQLWIVLARVGFDRSVVLRTDRIRKRAKNGDLLACLGGGLHQLFGPFSGRSEGKKMERYVDAAQSEGEIEALATSGGIASKREYGNNDDDALQSSSSIEIVALHRGQEPPSAEQIPFLELRNLARSVPLQRRRSQDDISGHDSDGIPPPVENGDDCRRVLFRDFSLSVERGEILAVRGPSGSGKSQLLRTICGLSPVDGGDILLRGVDRSLFGGMCLWRRSVRYVTQYKVDVPGTPRDFARRVSTLKCSYDRTTIPTSDDPTPSLEEMLATSVELLREWGMEPRDCLDMEWASLSGGEAQRVLNALALASRPKILLLDESTSALDLAAKIAVERSIVRFVAENDAAVLWVTHDPDQIERLSHI